MGKRALLLLGGVWHDFEGFRRMATPLLEGCGYQISASYDMDVVLKLAQGGVDLVAQYTSFGAHERFPGAAPGMTPAQAQTLGDWVTGGGCLLGVHSATAVGVTPNPIQEALYGARFVEHPPQFTFAVYPVAREHPLTAQVGALVVHDEFYVQAYGDDIVVHMVALDRGYAYPMAWTRAQGAGRVAYVGMGHSAAVWDLPDYRRLLTNAVAWLEGKG